MFNIFKLALRNLRRYMRRTLLTSSLITLGIVAVLLFVSISGSFKSMMIGQITDSMLGHLQVHRKGYLASIDSLPLDRNMKGKQIQMVKERLEQDENFEVDDDLMEWKAYLRLKEDRQKRLEDFQHERFRVA